ncbi:MAG: SufD family Fe-S cluster assembly protein [Planktomarina sp.]|nr:SufD family Fe-S cluster assembly protein [Planktomarina sp.]
MVASSPKVISDRALHDAELISNSGAWAKNARQLASARAQEQGLPQRRDEYWKYTRPDVFVQKNVALIPQACPEIGIFADQMKTEIVFENAKLATHHLPEIDNCKIESLSNASTLDLHWVQDIYGKLELAGQKPVERSLAALNTAMATEGLLVNATGQVSSPIRIHSVSIGITDAVIHHVVKVEAGASVTLIETGQYGARSNVVIEVDVADTGSFHHIRVQDGKESHMLTHIFASIGADAKFKSFTLTTDGKMTRNECILDLVGDNSSVTVAGACLGDSNFHHDDTVFITHDAVNCESRQVFKKVLRNGAVGVFQGKILVKAGAQKTDGYQISQSLLLDEDSQFLAKPELEIYADDVACSHGSTSGAIDEEALFYLRSRGVPEPKAVDLLTLSFIAQAIGEIEDPDLAQAILSYLTDILEAR